MWGSFGVKAFRTTCERRGKAAEGPARWTGKCLECLECLEAPGPTRVDRGEIVLDIIVVVSRHVCNSLRLQWKVETALSEGATRGNFKFPRGNDSRNEHSPAMFSCSFEIEYHKVCLESRMGWRSAPGGPVPDMQRLGNEIAARVAQGQFRTCVGQSEKLWSYEQKLLPILWRLGPVTRHANIFDILAPPSYRRLDVACMD